MNEIQVDLSKLYCLPISPHFSLQQTPSFYNTLSARKLLAWKTIMDPLALGEMAKIFVLRIVQQHIQFSEIKNILTIYIYQKQR